MSSRPIYLDYSATTPVDPRVVDKMVPWLFEHFGNPASRSHAFGWEAEEAVERARGQVAALVNADPREIIWTSGATESDNLAIKGAAAFYAERGKHIITVKTEHKAVLDPCRELERQGFEVTYLDVQENGLIDLEAFTAAIRPRRNPRLRPDRGGEHQPQDVRRSDAGYRNHAIGVGLSLGHQQERADAQPRLFPAAQAVGAARV